MPKIADRGGLAFLRARAREHQHAGPTATPAREEDRRQRRPERLGEQRASSAHATISTRCSASSPSPPARARSGRLRPGACVPEAELADRDHAKLRHAKVMRDVAGILKRPVGPLLHDHQGNARDQPEHQPDRDLARHVGAVRRVRRPGGVDHADVVGAERGRDARFLRALQQVVVEHAARVHLALEEVVVRGLLGLARDEARLADVLALEQRLAPLRRPRTPCATRVRMSPRDAWSDASIVAICARMRRTSAWFGVNFTVSCASLVWSSSSVCCEARRDSSSSTSGRPLGELDNAISYVDCFAIRSACAPDSSFRQSLSRTSCAFARSPSPSAVERDDQAGLAQVGLQLVLRLLQLDLQILELLREPLPGVLGGLPAALEVLVDVLLRQRVAEVGGHLTARRIARGISTMRFTPEVRTDTPPAAVALGAASVELLGAGGLMLSARRHIPSRSGG